MIEPNDNELPGHTNAANGRTRSTRASQRSGTLPPWKWNEVWSVEAPGVFRASSFARPIYRKEETERFRLTSTRKPKQNAKHRDENTKNHCVLETNLRLERGRPRHFGKITICPTKIAISSTIRSTTPRCSKRGGQSLSPCVEVNGHMPGRCQRGPSRSLPARSRRAASDRRRRRCAGQLGLRRAPS